MTIGAGVNLKACTSGIDCTAANLLPPATIGAPQVNNDAALLDAPSLLDPQQTDERPRRHLPGLARHRGHRHHLEQRRTH